MRHYPAAYLKVPDYLDIVKPLPSADEMARAEEIRGCFTRDGEPLPYMLDVVRAFRLLRGKRRYVEIGTFDKGCLAYAANLLAPTATIVDVDLQADPTATERLRRWLTPDQRLVTAIGDSASTAVQSQVEEALGGEPADAVFVDGNHAAPQCWADFSNYSTLMTPGGIMLFHDIYWQGTIECFGVSQAAEWIDRAHPLYVVFGDHPVHRFLPWLAKGDSVWGGVGILQF